MKPKVLPVAAGWYWWKFSLQLFRHRPGLFIFVTVVVSIILGIINGVLSVIPFLGGIVAALLNPAMMACMLCIPLCLNRFGTVSANDIVRPLGNRFVDLLKLAALQIVVSYVGIVLVSAVYVGETALDLSLFKHIVFNTENGASAFLLENFIQGQILRTPVAFLLYLCVIAVSIMIAWASPMLVGWKDLPVIESVVLSARGMLKNWAAFLVNGLIGLIFLFALSIFMYLSGTAGADFVVLRVVLIIALILAMLVLFPLMLANYYFSYETIFGDYEEASEAVVEEAGNLDSPEQPTE